MNGLKLLAVFFAVASSLSASAYNENAMDAVWGGAELRVASAATLDHFRAQKGDALFSGVTGVTLKVTAQGNAARAVVSYRENGEDKNVGYFCHTHDAAIDCH